MEQIYWLLLLATSVLSATVTIIYFKWNSIKRLFNYKIKLVYTEDKVRDIVYDVFKEMNTPYKKYIRQQVRAYLKELQTNETKTKSKNGKTST